MTFSGLPLCLVLSLLYLISLKSLCVSAQYASSFPAPIPLLVRSTYFGSWIYGGNGTLATPGGVWPEAWTDRTQRWDGFVRVDGTLWQWQGSGGTAAKTISIFMTPTRTIFTMEAGSVMFNLTYLDPVEPSDWVRQSFPFSYLAIDVWSTDGYPHSVQFYSDVSGQFVSSSDTNTIQWNTTQTSSSVYHQMRRTAALSIVEVDDLSEDGTAYFAASLSSPSLTWQTGAYSSAQTTFNSTGKLDLSADTAFRAINDYPVMAYAVDLGSITQSSPPIVFALGLVRDPIVRSVKAGGIGSRSSYFWTKYKTVAEGIDVFLSDFPSSLTRAIALDTKIMGEASSISSPYADLVALALRQTMAALEITISTQSNGEWNTSDVKAFMKDIGNSQRVNAVETLYAALPAYLYLNASLAGLLLDPLLEYQGSSQYTNNYAATDLGTSFPSVTGNNSNSALLAVENCGTMLVMALAHAQKSGEGSLIIRHYELLREWADYLVANTLQPGGYLTYDGLTGVTSNLALKGTIGIYAMGMINQALEPQGMLGNYTTYYLNKANEYATQWQYLAFATDHVTSAYGNSNTWGLVYNLYAARLLNSTIIPESIYDAQAAWYSQQAPSAPLYGFQYDGNDPGIVKAHWTMLTAGSIAQNSAGRDALIAMTHVRAFKPDSIRVTPTTYDTIKGGAISGRASAAYGAAFAILALNVPSIAITVPKEPSTTGDLDVAAIAGGIVGGVSGVLLIWLAVWLYLRRRRKIQEGTFVVTDAQSRRSETPTPNDPPMSSIITPFVDNAFPTSRRDSTGGSSSKGTFTSIQRERTPSIPLSGSRLNPTPHTRMQSNDSQQFTAGSSSPAESPSLAPTQPAEMVGLRTEVEQLRREMAALRRTQPEFTEEPPPRYGELLH